MVAYSQYIGETVNGNAVSPANYQGLVRDWANRDDNVLSRAVVERCLEWAADECYRRLRIPPLEWTSTYVVTAEDDITADTRTRGGNVLTFDLPADFIEMIWVYRTRDHVVFNYRVDNRTLIDAASDIQYNAFTREGNQLKLFGRFEVGDEIQVHYYRRLPALDATYTINATNFNAQTSAEQFFTYGTLATVTQAQTAGTGVYLPAAISAVGDIVYTGTNATVATDTFDGTTHNKFLPLTGKEAAHWLRDQNQRILMFGAMMEVFSYLDEPESFAKYQARFIEEIRELNDQEKRRDAMGGNVQVSYNSSLI